MALNICLVYPNAIDTATLSASPAFLASLPLENVQDPARGRVARTPGLAVQSITGNLAAAARLSALVISHHNLSVAASVRLRCWRDHNQAGPLMYDSGAVALGSGMIAWGTFAWGDPGMPNDDFTPRLAAHYFAAVVAASFSLEITDTANTDTYLEIGRLVLGDLWRPEFNIALGGELSWADGSKQSRTDGGSLRTETRAQWRRWSFDLSYLSDTERAELMAKLRGAGLAADLFVSCAPGAGGAQERDAQGLAKIVQMPSLSQVQSARWATKLVLEEI